MHRECDTAEQGVNRYYRSAVAQQLPHPRASTYGDEDLVSRDCLDHLTRRIHALDRVGVYEGRTRVDVPHPLLPELHAIAEVQRGDVVLDV